MAYSRGTRANKRRGVFQLSARLFSALAVSVAVTLATGFFLHEFRLGARVRNFSYDLLHVWSGDLRPSDGIIVYLDDISHDKLGQSWTASWDRALHAQLVERLTTAGARAIVFDIVFSDPNSNNPAADARFAAAIKRHG